MKQIHFLLLFIGFGLTTNAQTTCMNPDVNCDGYVNISDLLGLLGFFGAEDLDGDGIWDSQDPCIEDECGVCDGPGAQVLVVDSIFVIQDSIYIQAIDDWYVFEVADTTFTVECAMPGCMDPSAENYDSGANLDDGNCIFAEGCLNQLVMVFDDYSYPVVQIGNQCWFKESLRSTHFANGESIAGNLSASEWSTTVTAAQAVYGEAGSPCFGGACDPVSNLMNYGRLYNWYAVDDARGLCPSGWHVPTDADWKNLEMELGLSQSDADAMGWRGTDEGEQLKASSQDVPMWDGTNTSGFKGLPGGFREYDASFLDVLIDCSFWSSSWDDSQVFPWYRTLYPESGAIWRAANYQVRSGFQVRCLKD